MNDIRQYIPDDMLSELMQIAVDTRKSRWSIGDITNLIIGVGKAAGFEIMPIYNQVAVWLNHEFAPRTIRYYAAVSAFYDQPTRYEFDELPYTLFARAMQYGPRWRNLLEAAQMEAGKIGHPPSDDWMINYAMLPAIQIDEAPAIPYQDDSSNTWFEDINSLRQSIPVSLPDMLRQRIAELLEELLTLIKEPLDK